MRPARPRPGPLGGGPLTGTAEPAVAAIEGATLTPAPKGCFAGEAPGAGLVPPRAIRMESFKSSRALLAGLLVAVDGGGGRGGAPLPGGTESRPKRSSAAEVTLAAGVAKGLGAFGGIPCAACEITSSTNTQLKCRINKQREKTENDYLQRKIYRK